MLFVFFQLISCADRIQLLKNSSTLIKFRLNKQKAIKETDDTCFSLCENLKSYIEIPSSYNGCSDVCADTDFTNCVYSCDWDHIETMDEIIDCVNPCFNSQRQPDQQCLDLCDKYESKLSIPSSYNGCSGVCSDTAFTSCFYNQCNPEKFKTEAEALDCVNTKCFNSQSQPDQECLGMCEDYKSQLDIPSSYNGCSDVCSDTAFTSCFYNQCNPEKFKTEAEALDCVNTKCFNSQSQPDQECLGMCEDYKSQLDIPSSYSGCSDVCSDTDIISCLHNQCNPEKFKTEAEALDCVNTKCFNSQSQPDQECLGMCEDYKSQLDIPSSYSGCSDVCSDTDIISCLHNQCNPEKFKTEAEALDCVNTKCFKDDDGLSTGAIVGIVIAVIVVVAVVVVVVVIVIRKKKASNKSSDEENRQENV